MKRRVPIALQLLVGLVANFVLLLVLFAALPGRSGIGWNVLVTDSARARSLTVADALGQALSALPRERWQAQLAGESARQRVRFALTDVRPPGPGLPPGFDRPPFDADRGGPPPGEGVPPQAQAAQQDRAILADMISLERQGWSGGFALRVPMQIAGRPTDLQVEAGTLAMLRFLGIEDWALFVALSLAGTLLIWTPFAWRLTRTLGSLTRATQTVAEGRFDIRVDARRRDELGQLAESVNHMAERLERQLESQKQFVADVAHEVTAPLARMQIGLALLGDATDGREAAVKADLQDDVEQMSAMLDELLLFTRTGRTAVTEAAQPCALLALVESVVGQETLTAVGPAAVTVTVAKDLSVFVPRALIQRALANLVRNALRHGRRDIEVQAAAAGASVRLCVRDRGPGVPEAALSRLGEPFFRPDFARERSLGGTGLGLAIVRRCVAAANGSVVFSNREGGGFESIVTLPRHSAEPLS